MPIKGTGDKRLAITLRIHSIVRLYHEKANREYHWNHKYVLSIYTHYVFYSVFAGKRDNGAGKEINGSAY